VSDNTSIKSLASQTAIYGLGSVIPRVLNYLLLTPFYTRVLSTVSDYGTHSYLYAYCALILVLLTFGMETTFFRYARQHGLKKVYSTSTYFLIFNSLIFIVLIFAFQDTVTDLININRKDYMWYFAGIILFDVVCAIPFATLRYLEKAKLFTILKLINITVNIAVNLFYFWLIPLLKQKTSIDFSSIYSESNLLEYAFRANLIASIVTLLLLLPYSCKYFTKFDYKLFVDMLKYSSPILISGIFGMVNEVFDKVLLEKLIPIENNPFEQIGIYSANYKIAALMTIFIQMFRFGAEPFIFKIAGEKDSKDKYRQITKYFLYAGLLVFLSVMLYIDLFKYLISSRFHSGLSILPYVLIALFFFGLYYTISFWYKITDKTKYAAYLSLLGAIITISANYILVPIYGYPGAAYATLICYSTMFFVSFYLNQKYYRIDYEIKKFITVFVAAILLYIISTLITIDNLLIKMLINTILLIIFITFVIRIDKEINIKKLINVKSKSKK